MELRALGTNVSSWMIYPVAFALVVIGVNCWMIAHYGSPTPVWDHWAAEGAILYLKYLGGTLQVSDLIAPPNEHAYGTLLLELGGYWDPILQMVANTPILGAVVRAVYRGVRPDPGPPVMVGIRIVHDDDFFASLARGDLILQ